MSVSAAAALPGLKEAEAVGTTALALRRLHMQYATTSKSSKTAPPPPPAAATITVPPPPSSSAGGHGESP